MKSWNKSILMMTCVLGAAMGCEDDPTNPPPADSGVDLGTTTDMGPADMGPVDPCATAPATQTVSTNITSNTTWCANTTVTLGARIYVENNAVLTIQPGVTVRGTLGSALVVTRSARVEANGTAASPIVFTSNNAAGGRAPGDWGGVVLFGRAPNNQGADVVFEGLTAEERHTYGGTVATHDCGTLQHVRIEFAGEQFATGKEFNGLTVASCGSDTTLSHIQVHRGADDGIEFFGGNANLDHAIVTGSDDDALDWDFGYTGRIQYLVAHQLETIGDNGIEADNNALGTITVGPRSAPTIYNATFLGGGAGAAKSQKILLRRATVGLLRNVIFQDFRGGLVIEPPTTTNEANFASHWPAELTLEGSFFSGVNVPATTATATGDLPNVDPTCTASCAKDTSVQQSFDLLNLVSATARGNTLNAAALVTVGTGALPNYCPATGTAAVTGATSVTGIDAAGLTYAGACAPGTAAASAWYAGWTAFPAN